MVTLWISRSNPMPCFNLIDWSHIGMIMLDHVAGVVFDFNSLKNLIGLSISESHLIGHGLADWIS